ncbi:MAG: Sugar-specific transcriptional regulator TrmB family [Candidatus Uhrbacteria bacterium GW2011_GWA2_53_10]|uniref:Sugar-specific transcriptional regulator TrmB family n=1 Tax=Candidatus Uhrbacteria bacterium GW2011_GWA2_53_10 TaxID=1618980 RepID=A0A0G1XP66_9BACT|nr:MAG: Sugar-specific transcriptional regulator TrmB family [Candidatus Uhrbacteria bacterium GW2011_GWA2_53_10]
MASSPILSEKTLELLGLSSKDWNVYMAVLRLGSAPLRRVAEAVNLNRGTTYDALKRLIDVGLVSYVDAKTHRYFTGEDPHKLRGIATRREVALQEARHGLENVIPGLQEVLGSAEHRPSVRYYDGDSGVRDILEDVLATTGRAETKLYRVYSSTDIRDLIASAWPGFTKERIRRQVRVRAIAMGKGGATVGLDERKWAVGETKSPVYIFIYAGKTAYVATDARKQLFGVLIEDPAVAATQQVIFDALWKFLP